MGGTASERVFEFMDDQAIAIDTQALEFVSLVSFTHGPESVPGVRPDTSTSGTWT